MERTRIVKWMRRFSVAAIAILLGCAAASVILARMRQSALEPPSSILFEKDIVYTKIEGKPLLIDVASPRTGAGPFPVILCIHGGGWRAGDKTEFREGLFARATAGVCCGVRRLPACSRGSLPRSVSGRQDRGPIPEEPGPGTSHRP